MSEIKVDYIEGMRVAGDIESAALTLGDVKPKVDKGSSTSSAMSLTCSKVDQLRQTVADYQTLLETDKERLAMLLGEMVGLDDALAAGVQQGLSMVTEAIHGVGSLFGSASDD